MKCSRCGSEISKDKIYCETCGKAIQLVPDYNVFDEELLSDIVQKGGSETVFSLNEKEVETVQQNMVEKHNIRKIKNIMLVVFFSFILVLCAVCVLILFAEEAKKEQASNFDYQMSVAEKYQSKQDYENALIYYRNAWNLHPDDINIPYIIEDIYEEQGRIQDSIELLQQLITKHVNDTLSYERLIAIYGQQKAYDKILNLFEQITDKTKFYDLFEDYLVDQPKFSRISGTYHDYLEIELSSTSGLDIYYTLDGSDPATNGKKYISPISLRDGTTTIFAVCVNEKGIYSEKVHATYYIESKAPEQAKASLSEGVYDSPQQITLTYDTSCQAFYAWDIPPTADSEKYIGPIDMLPGDHCLNVVVINQAGIKSPVISVHYQLNLP